jgi:hypothetical protein
MMEECTFKHVATNNNGRVHIYECSKVLVNKADGKRYRTERQSRRFYATKERDRNNLITKHIPTVFKYVAISDAHTHIERLAFPAWRCKPLEENNIQFVWLCDNIAGYNTMMIHGGNPRAVKPHEVYLRMLAKANGYQYTKPKEE